MDSLDARELLGTQIEQEPNEMPLAFSEAVGGQSRTWYDRDRVPQRLLQESTQHRDQSIREVIEATEPGEPEETRRQNDQVRGCQPRSSYRVRRTAEPSQVTLRRGSCNCAIRVLQREAQMHPTAVRTLLMLLSR